MAKPDWQLKHSDRGRSRVRDYREPMRNDVVLHLASNKRPNGPRPDNSNPQLPKQGVNGALRAANLRLLLEKAPVREALALVAEVPLERLEAMSRGALCPDETAFHIERALKLPGKWLDGLNKEVPERTLELLKHPDEARLHDEDFDEEMLAAPAVAAAAAVQSAAGLSVVIRPESGLAQAPIHVAAVPHSQATEVGPLACAHSAQGKVVLAADGTNAMADGGSKAAARPAAQTSEAATVAALIQPHSSAAVARSKSDSKTTDPMPSPELRQRNLSLLLQGKGAKSAMARVIGISQPYMSTIANGGKVLDQDFCRNIAQALGMPEDWFEAPRTVADIPAVALRRLAPLPRGKGAGAEATLTGDTAPAQATAVDTAERAAPKAGLAAAHPSEAATAATGTTEEKAVTASVPSEQTGVQEKNLGRQSALQGDNKQRGNTTGPAWDAARMAAAAPVQADLLSTVEPEVAVSMPVPPPATQADVVADPSKDSNPAPVRPAVAAAASRTLPAARDISPVSAPPLILEGGLAPITEALIKILALKDRQGALSEDKAFELLGAVRVL